MTDPISAAIDAAVDRAVSKHIDRLVDAMKSASARSDLAGLDAFLPLPEACLKLGIHRSTLLRMEADGRVPARRRMAGRTGYLISDIAGILKALANTKDIPATCNVGPAHAALAAKRAAAKAVATQA